MSNSNRPDAQPSCSPYVITQPSIISTFPRTAFYAIYEPGTVAALADGSAVVEESPYALFRTLGMGLASAFWAPATSRYYPPTTEVWISRPGASPTNYYSAPRVHVSVNGPRPQRTPRAPMEYFYLLGSFGNTAVIQLGSDWIYGIGSDGSVGFRFSRAGTELQEQPAFVGRDPDGTLWFVSSSKRFNRDTVFAVFLPARKVVALSEPVENVFQGPSGFIYARAGQNLVRLSSIPRVQARYYRGPIPLKGDSEVGADELAISRLGADGSAWSSTSVQVIHEHPNGRVHVIGLSRNPTTITHMPVPFDLHLAPDGSVWIARYDKLVRITKDDRVQLMNMPFLGFYPELRIAPDSTVWLKTTDDARALLHIAAPRATSKI